MQELKVLASALSIMAIALSVYNIYRIINPPESKRAKHVKKNSQPFNQMEYIKEWSKENMMTISRRYKRICPII